MQNSFKSKLKYFVLESVKPRTLDEYACIFSRGMSGSSNGLPRAGALPQRVERVTVPWLWLRVLAFGLIAFSFMVLAFRLGGGATDLMAAALYGALPFNLAVLVFFYELYPKRDLSLLFLIFVLLAGGGASCVLVSLGYAAVDPYPFMDNEWTSLVFTAVWEEFAKAVAAIGVILHLKNKNPLWCFLIGFAVGTGYSYLEDLGYIYAYSRGGNTLWVVLMSVGRGLSCACSHAPWTGIICWAFAYFKNPFSNFRFWLVSLVSVVLHYFADVPFFIEELMFLKGLNFGWLIEIVVVGAIWAAVYFIIKKSFKSLGCGIFRGQLQINAASATRLPALSRQKKFAHAANVTALCCALALSVINMAGCCAVKGTVTQYSDLSDEDFIALIQNGLPLKADWSRPYDEEQGDFSNYVYNGQKLRAVQRETEGDYDYFYYYTFSEDSEPALGYIAVMTENEVYYCNRIVVYRDYIFHPSSRPVFYDDIIFDRPEDGDNPEQPDVPSVPEEPEEPEEPSEPEKPQKMISYFGVSENSVYGAHFYYSLEQGFRIVSGETFEGLAVAVSLGAAFVAVSAGGIAAVAILKNKEKKND